ncbi:MaoC family dehydratase [Sanguibacter sp. 25GB23B1]|uniref:MaoC family dehydratase n=1 Tax=unclassified Sanguibacter TaxID=2645534 RepID=UPI0032AED21F
MTHYAHPTELLDAVGSEHGPSDWLAIEQDRVDAFAAATDDEQWIHVDPERAAAGPFGGTIAHGYLTLSLLPALTGKLFTVDGIAMAVNYGLDRVRFLQPVRVGSRVRAHGQITSAETVTMGIRVGMAVTVEIEGTGKPALVAETIAVFVPAV